MPFKVLVACLEKWDTSSEIPFLLNMAGCETHVYCAKDSWLRSNKFHDKWHESPSNLNDYKVELVKLVLQYKFDWVILADDPLIKHMNEQVNEEEFHLIMPVKQIKARNALSSKKGFSEFCKNNGIDTPGYVVYNDTEDLLAIKETLKFPVINKLDFSWGGTDMFISHTFEEFEANLHKIPKNQHVLIQEYIDGEEIRTDALFFNGVLVNYFRGRILSNSQNSFSYSTRRVYENDTEFKDNLIEVGSKLGLHGFINITYIFDRTRNIKYLIEVDPRPNSWMVLSRFLSTDDFIAGTKRIVSGEYVSGYQGGNLNKDNIELALFYKDIRRVLWKKDFKGLMRWTLNLKCYWKFIPFYDSILLKRILKAVWDEVFMFYIRRITGRKKKTI
jgi:hypothetical protein